MPVNKKAKSPLWPFYLHEILTVSATSQHSLTTGHMFYEDIRKSRTMVIWTLEETLVIAFICLDTKINVMFKDNI